MAEISTEDLNEAQHKGLLDSIKDSFREVYFENTYSNEGKTKEVVIRTGKAQDLLPLKEKLKTEIVGSIFAPAEYCKHRANTIDAAHSYVMVDEANDKITLVVNEREPNDKITIVGKLKEHPEARLFEFNEPIAFSIQELRDKFKPLRHYFASQQEYVQIVSKLNTFNVKIETIVEDHKNEGSGAINQKLSRTIQNDGVDISFNFNVKIKIFTDAERYILPVELHPVLQSNQVKFLISCVDFYETSEKLKWELFNKTLEQLPPIPVYNAV